MKTRKQAEKKHEIKVGLTVVIGIAILIFAIFSVGNQQGILSDRYKLRVLMSRVNGLQTGAPVRLAGVRVGSVVGVEFADDVKDPKIEVILEVDKKVQQRIREDSRAHIGTLGLLGDKFVGITMGTLDEPVLKNDDLLSSSDPIDLEKLLDEGVIVFDGLKKATLDINEITNKINKGKGTLGLLVNDPRIYIDLDKILNIMEILSQKVAKGEGAISMMLDDTTFSANLASSLKNIHAISDSLKKGQGSAGKFINNPKIYNELAETTLRLNKIIEKIEKGDGTLGKTINNKELYQDMIRVTSELDSLIKDVRKNPQRYLKVELF